MTTLTNDSTLTPPLRAILLQAMALTARMRAVVSHAEDARAPQAQAQGLGLGLGLGLEHNAIHPIERPLGRTITCESGTLWLTFDNTLRDVVLEGGESHHCATNNRLLIQALQGSRVRVH